MKILGVDTSVRSSGWGVVESVGSSVAALGFGTIPNPPARKLSECLKQIYSRIVSLIAEFRPDAVAVEGVIYAKNARTMLILGQARGAVICAASAHGTPVFEYEPRRVKQSVCGNGLAEKEQVQRMIKTLLHLETIPQNDAADALAIAIAHIHSVSGIAALAPMPI